MEGEAGSGRPVRELWWLQARQDQSVKQDRAGREGSEGPEGDAEGEAFLRGAQRAPERLPRWLWSLARGV